MTCGKVKFLEIYGLHLYFSGSFTQKIAYAVNVKMRRVTWGVTVRNESAHIRLSLERAPEDWQTVVLYIWTKAKSWAPGGTRYPNTKTDRPSHLKSRDSKVDTETVLQAGGMENRGRQKFVFPPQRMAVSGLEYRQWWGLFHLRWRNRGGKVTTLSFDVHVRKYTSLAV